MKLKLGRILAAWTLVLVLFSLSGCNESAGAIPQALSSKCLNLQKVNEAILQGDENALVSWTREYSYLPESGKPVSDCFKQKIMDDYPLANTHPLGLEHEQIESEPITQNGCKEIVIGETLPIFSFTETSITLRYQGQGDQAASENIIRLVRGTESTPKIIQQVVSSSHTYICNQRHEKHRVQMVTETRYPF